MSMRLVVGTMLVAFAAAPGLASGGIDIPEPSDPWLFALGVVGLIVGRQVAKRRPPP